MLLSNMVGKEYHLDLGEKQRKNFQTLEACGTGKVKKLPKNDFDKLDRVVFGWFILKAAKLLQLMEC